MNEEHTLNYDELESHRSFPTLAGQTRYRNGTTSPSSARPPERPRPPETFSEKNQQFSVDPGTLIQALFRRWYVVVLASAIMLALGVLIGLSTWSGSFTSTAQLIRNDPSSISELFHPQPLETATLVSMIQSPEVLQKTGARLRPSLTGPQVGARLEVNAERSTDITTVTASAADARTATALVNIFCEEAVRYTQEIQRQEAITAGSYVKRQLEEAEADLASLRKSMPAAVSALVPPGGTNGKLQLARDELTTLLVRYTEAHPLVREQRARIAALTAQATTEAAAPLAPTAPVGSGPAVSSQNYDSALNQLRTLESNHSNLLSRHRVFEMINSRPPGYLRVLLPAAPEDAQGQRPWMKIGIVSIFFCALGFVCGLGEILSREMLDNRVKTPADIKRITKLPLLATLGDLRRMSPEKQNAWAFRTWIALQSRLNRAANRGLICGVTSALPGDGRSTLISLLAHAASQCGFRVLTITASPGASTHHPKKDKAAPPPSEDDGDRAANELLSITSNMLSTPSQVAEKLRDPDSQPMVNIPLPGWVWDLDRRKQWQSALEMWRKIENIVILVELPPASVPEAVLLAENLPNLIWLTESGRADAMETRMQLETLRQGRSNLIGSVLNRAPSSFLNGRFARWFGCLAVASTLGIATPHAVAQEAAPVPSYMMVEAKETKPTTFSVGASTPRAAWQQKLTLGPGDVLTLGLFGAPELTREEVPIGPDGRISYLEALDVVANGLTIDELRQRLGDELGKFRRAPQPIINPIAYRSKKYFVLGKVVQKGSFMLDRPVTIIEAVARARGFETGLADRNLVELADLSRSFLARGGHHIPVNFEKLFLEGDLTQNVPLEPNDYLYFPAGDLKEIYVLGEVMQPGAQTFNQGASAVSAIAGRGGFTDRAWKKRILIIRGSLNHPETFVVNAADVLLAKSADFKLQPKDIIYVSHRPWIRAEELLDIVATAFVEAATVTWTGIHVYPN
jgi:protein involved in polysaccharide export with SLBB domain/capsular polysaccharide biosynthesis protein